MLIKFLLYWFAFFVLLFYDADSQGVNSYPEVGKKSPSFTLHNIQGFEKIQASLNDFRGRYIILDFWNKGCAACIKSFPKTNQLSFAFKDKVKIIVVGTEEPGIQEMYEKFKRRYQLSFITAFDFPLYNRFVYGGAPHLIWIDKNGIVRAVTSHLAMTEENIQSFITDKEFKFLDRSYKAQQLKKYDINTPYLVNNNGGRDSAFSYRFMLSKFDPSSIYYHGFEEKIDSYSNGRMEGIADLNTLYLMAYTGHPYINFSNELLYGKFYPLPVLELQDTTPFTDRDFEVTGKGYFLYSQIIPSEKVTPKYSMGIMQQNLNTFFGYSCKIEKRMMPCWKLVCSDSARDNLNTKGGEPKYAADHSFLSLRNLPVGEMLNAIRHKHFYEPPIIDETNLTGNIDIDLAAYFSDLRDVKQKLNRLGLDLIMTEVMMEVLVVKDPPND